MEVIITEWAKQTYLDLRGKVFTRAEYKNTLRPDAELLKTSYPSDPKFGNDKFWGPAKHKGNILKYGHKMKWHNFGNGNVQLRLGVVIVETELEGKKKERAFLCRSYIKNDKTEKREMAKLKIHIKKIVDGNYTYRGQL
ncbi:MAG: hypothetical protein KAQ98_05685 [Bacteriovoracaceae bacterium]|nr:hypothetical protein [Bacteriovoracaceae bacterium]